MIRLLIISIITIVLSITILNAKNGQNYYRYGDIKTKLNKRAIFEIAKGELRRLSIEKKVPKSWKFVPLLDIQKDHKDSNWVVSFTNLKIKHKKNQILYIRISEYGVVIGDSYAQSPLTKR